VRSPLERPHRTRASGRIVPRLIDRVRGTGRLGEDLTYRPGQAVERRLPVAENVDPLPGRKLVAKRPARVYRREAHRKNRDVAACRDRKLLLDLGRFRREFREKKDDARGPFERVDDRLLIVLARTDIPERDPTPEPFGFEEIHDLACGRCILGRKTNKYMGLVIG
jgi:hypothetical protein